MALSTTPSSTRRNEDRREPLHARHDGGGQRPHQDGRAEQPPDRKTDDAGTKEDGERGEHGRDDPHDRLDALDRDAEQERPVGVLGARTDGDADVRVAEERHERDDHDRDGDHRDDVVAAEDRLADRETEVERRREALRRRLDVEGPRQQDAADGEQQ